MLLRWGSTAGWWVEGWLFMALPEAKYNFIKTTTATQRKKNKEAGIPKFMLEKTKHKTTTRTF